MMAGFKKYKLTVLVLGLVVVPFGLYALWMMYGWIFFSFAYSDEDFIKTYLATMLLIAGVFVASLTYGKERRR